MSDHEPDRTDGGGGWQAPPPPPPQPPYAGEPAPPAGGQGGQWGQQLPPPPPPQGGYAPPPPGGYGQPQYGYQPYPTAPQTEGGAIGALIASILAWMFCPVIPAIVALVMIPGSKRKIDESGGRLTGDGLLTAAKWVSWINIAFYGLIIVGVIFLIIIGAMAGVSDTSSDFSVGVVLSA